MRKEIIEKVAMIIYYHENGVYPGEFQQIYGHEQISWETLNDDQKEKLRIQSREVLGYLNYSGLIKF